MVGGSASWGTFELLRSRQSDDGYELAKVLEQHNLLCDIDFNCIEELENWRHCIERQTNKARRNWLQFAGFINPFSLGDAVLINGHWGSVSIIEDYYVNSGNIGYRPNDTDMNENHFHIAGWEKIDDWIPAKE